MLEAPRLSLHPVQVHVKQCEFVELHQRKVSFFERMALAVGHTDEIRHSPWPLHELSNLAMFILDTQAEQLASPVPFGWFCSLYLKHSP